MKEMIGGCCVCSDEQGWADNPLVYCDGKQCTVAVHQACYGIEFVPSGPWFCKKCAFKGDKSKVFCKLCPNENGALKRTDTNEWAHVICALYIPEVEFGNVKTMEPIIISNIPKERFNKVCYICENQQRSSLGAVKNVGACMACHKHECPNSFHVTCGQKAGLLCEKRTSKTKETNVIKYTGFCSYHYKKEFKPSQFLAVPAYVPPSMKDIEEALSSSSYSSSVSRHDSINNLNDNFNLNTNSNVQKDTNLPSDKTKESKITAKISETTDENLLFQSKSTVALSSNNTTSLTSSLSLANTNSASRLLFKDVQEDIFFRKYEKYFSSTPLTPNITTTVSNELPPISVNVDVLLPLGNTLTTSTNSYVDPNSTLTDEQANVSPYHSNSVSGKGDSSCWSLSKFINMQHQQNNPSSSNFTSPPIIEKEQTIESSIRKSEVSLPSNKIEIMTKDTQDTKLSSKISSPNPNSLTDKKTMKKFSFDKIDLPNHGARKEGNESQKGDIGKKDDIKKFEISPIFNKTGRSAEKGSGNKSGEGLRKKDQSKMDIKTVTPYTKSQNKEKKESLASTSENKKSGRFSPIISSPASHKRKDGPKKSDMTSQSHKKINYSPGSSSTAKMLKMDPESLDQAITPFVSPSNTKIDPNDFSRELLESSPDKILLGPLANTQSEVESAMAHLNDDITPTPVGTQQEAAAPFLHEVSVMEETITTSEQVPFLQTSTGVVNQSISPKQMTNMSSHLLESVNNASSMMAYNEMNPSPKKITELDLDMLENPRISQMFQDFFRAALPSHLLNDLNSYKNMKLEQDRLEKHLKAVTMEYAILKSLYNSLI